MTHAGRGSKFEYRMKEEKFGKADDNKTFYWFLFFIYIFGESFLSLLVLDNFLLLLLMLCFMALSFVTINIR